VTRDERRAVVLMTLKHLAWMTDSVGAPCFNDAIFTMEHSAPGEWDCCPLCEEVVCDDDCPLYVTRAGVDFEQVGERMIFEPKMPVGVDPETSEPARPSWWRRVIERARRMRWRSR
jgi:hypothetical protein